MKQQEFVFISYAHKDRDRVMPVIRALQEAGISLWFDEGSVYDKNGNFVCRFQNGKRV